MNENGKRVWARWRLLCVLSVGLLVGCEQMSYTPQQQVFIEKYERAHVERNLEGMLALYCWDGVAESIQGHTQVAIESDFDFPLRSVSFEDLQPEDAIDYVLEGQRFVSNLTPLYRLVVVYEDEYLLHRSFAVGRQEKALLIVNPSPVGAAGSALAD